MQDWAARNGVELRFIQPGKPVQNAYIESFNSRFRDECLSQHWFASLSHMRSVIDVWREDYNEHRPHSALGYLPPAKYAATLKAPKKESNGPKISDTIKPPDSNQTPTEVGGSARELEMLNTEKGIWNDMTTFYVFEKSRG